MTSQIKTLKEKKERLDFLCNKFHTTDKEDEEIDKLSDDEELYKYLEDTEN